MVSAIILIGIFVKDAAESSYKQMVMNQRFEGKLVEDIMQRNPGGYPAGHHCAKFN